MPSIVQGALGTTAETAILLGRHFGTSAELYMRLRTARALAVARAATSDANDICDRPRAATPPVTRPFCAAAALV